MTEARKPDLVDIACTVRHGTDKASLIDDGTTQVWLPNSQIEVEASADGRAAIVTMPMWLAKEKGLI